MTVDPDANSFGAAVRDLIDKQAILELVPRYCRGIDRMDADMVRDCFHDDATDEHGSFRGTADEFVAWAFDLLAGYDSTFHFIGNQLVELGPAAKDRTARCESYGIAHHRRAGGADHKNLITGFRYIDDLERRGLSEPWRIARRIAVTEWSRVEPEDSWWSVPDGFTVGARDRTDPVYGQPNTSFGGNDDGQVQQR